MLVPPLIKWLNPIIKKWFKLPEFDPQTKARITTKQYPSYFGILYGFWILSLFGAGATVLLLMVIYGQDIFPDKSYAVPVFIGLINMIGAWFLCGALLDLLFWKISSENFRDYVMYWQWRTGWGYDIGKQITTFFIIGIIYTACTLPITLLLIII